VSTPRSLALPHRVLARQIETARGTFAVLQASPGRGVCERRPALLVPGYTGSKEDFLPVLQSLAAAGRRVYALDQRGQYETHGPADPTSYLPDSLAADVLAVALAVADGDGEKGVHLLGHSLGGLIARQAVLADASSAILSLTLLGSGPASIGGRRAELVRAMLAVLGAPTADVPEPGAARVPATEPGAAEAVAAESAAAGRAGADIASAGRQLHDRVKKLWAEQLAPQARAEGVPEYIIAFLRERTLRTSPVGLIMMGRYLLHCPDRTAELAALPATRILVVFGENDDAWRPDAQDRMARRLRAQRICIPGAAHSPAIEAPETTASTLTDFWNAAERASRQLRSVSGRQHGGGLPPARGPAAGSG